MFCVVLWLLSAVLAEMAVLVWMEIRDRRGKRHRDDVGPAEEPERERQWQEGVSAMMGYDLNTARKAVRRDDDEER